jgi:hypothetical protein
MRPVYIGLIIVVAGCAATAPPTHDPVFDEAWDEDAVNQSLQPREEYLKWVSNFYEGSPFVPGWTKRQEELIAPLSPAEAPVAKARLDKLGCALAAEWAKDNHHRRVSSDVLKRVAEILVEARDEGRLVDVVDAILRDVKSLIAGELKPKAITKERYVKVA